MATIRQIAEQSERHLAWIKDIQSQHAAIIDNHKALTAYYDAVRAEHAALEAMRKSITTINLPPIPKFGPFE